jgi:hypothetical protein
MTTESFIAGKDASLKSSISRMQAKLGGIGFHVEERFFNIEAPGMALKGCDMHHRLLTAYAKLQAQK